MMERLKFALQSEVDGRSRTEPREPAGRGPQPGAEGPRLRCGFIIVMIAFKPFLAFDFCTRPYTQVSDHWKFSLG